jgi:signal transduction histidine kinase
VQHPVAAIPESPARESGAVLALSWQQSQANVARLRAYLLAHRRSRESFSDRQLQTTLGPLLAQLRTMSGVERRLLAQGSDILVRHQRNLRLLEATRGLAILLLVGRDFAEFFSEPERAKAGYQKVFTEGMVRDDPLTLRHLSGALMPVLYNASTYRDARGQVIGVFAAARGVTQIRRMEEQLRSSNASLEQKVRARTTELTRVNQELESFASSISHDLRAPLRAIDGFSLQLVRGYCEQLDEQGRRLLQVVCDNPLRMGQLIDDLLRFSRLGRRALERGPVEMDALARGVAAELLDLEADRQIAFTCQQLPPAQGDPPCCGRCGSTCWPTRSSSPAGDLWPTSRWGEGWRGRKCTTGCRTTAPVSTWPTPTSSSASSSVCAARMAA